MKHCNGCNTDKPVEEFAWKNSSTGLRQSKCRECKNAISQQHYLDNKEKYKAKSAKANLLAVQRSRIFIHDYLSTHPCVDCGHDDVRVLQFDHVRGKNCNVGALVRGSLESLKAEIALCDVRCANCHMIRTGSMYGWRVDKRDSLL